MRNSDSEAESPMIHNISQEARRFKQYVAAISVCLGATCAGTVLSWSSPALSQMLPANVTTYEKYGQITESRFVVTHTQAALVGSMVGVGAMMSAVPVGYFADNFGRKRTIQGLALPFMISWVLTILSYNPVMLITGRFLAGIGTGGICVVAPIYIGEIAETSLRGTLGALVNTCLSSGILFTCIVGAFTSWITLSAILLTIPVLFLITISFMPESPVYLLQNNYMTAAEKSLREFRGSAYNIDTELKLIQRNLEKSETNVKISDLFLSKAYRSAFFAGIIVMSLQQFCGINAIVFYTGPIFKTVGSRLHPDVVAIVINAVQVVASYFAILIIEKANRKFYLILSAVGMTTCLTGLGIFFHLKYIYGNIDGYDFLPIFSAILYMISFCIGFGPVPWLLLGEIFAPEVRGIAAGTAVTMNWFCASLVTLSFPLLEVSIGIHYTFYIFAGVNIVGICLITILIPETRGRTLEEIQNILQK